MSMKVNLMCPLVEVTVPSYLTKPSFRHRSEVFYIRGYHVQSADFKERRLPWIIRVGLIQSVERPYEHN